MNNVVKTLAASAALSLLAGAVFAQTQTGTPLPAKKPGILSRLFHPKPKPGIYQNNATPGHPMNGYPMHGQPMHGSMGAHSYGTMGTHSYGTMGTHPMMGGGGMMGGHSMMGGPIIGNKNSHVYHMAGDRGALPAPQNRVYFNSAAAAQAAGYHAAGSSRGMTSGRSMMHGSMRPH